MISDRENCRMSRFLLSIVALTVLMAGCRTPSPRFVNIEDAYGCVRSGRNVKILSKSDCLTVFELLDSRIENSESDESKDIDWSMVLYYPAVKGCEMIPESQWILSESGHIKPCSRFARRRIYKLPDREKACLLEICRIKSCETIGFRRSKVIENSSTNDCILLPGVIPGCMGDGICPPIAKPNRGKE